MAAHSSWGAEELAQLFPLGIWVGTGVWASFSLIPSGDGK